MPGREIFENESKKRTLSTEEAVYFFEVMIVTFDPSHILKTNTNAYHPNLELSKFLSG